MTEPRQPVRATSPCLVVSNLDQSIAFYCGKLGFAEPALWGDPPCFAMMHRDGFDVMLRLAGAPDRIHPNGPDGIWDLYIHVDDVRAEVAALGAAGVAIDADLCDTAYQMSEIEIVDPDGYRICFGSPKD
jgi:catechol 2,3-dioxygenase-like lactoylglutathione lyase family enzyme